ncbi:PepSY domain-containing protein [Aquihabitans sp. McL0605]|uniref:PepSY domain-containing protein n=1 Tax=Aquihabitans sp. McL0605 TaxID=3415671 RepID=UPI003CEACF65
MSTRTKFIIGAAAAGALTLGAGVAATANVGSRNTDPVAEQRAEQHYTDAHRGQAHVTQAQAERLALSVRPGQLIESHLQDEGDGLRWEVKTADADHVWEVQLDPATGAVVGNQVSE